MLLTLNLTDVLKVQLDAATIGVPASNLVDTSALDQPRLVPDIVCCELLFHLGVRTLHCEGNVIKGARLPFLKRTVGDDMHDGYVARVEPYACERQLGARSSR